jgi:beta-glucosidase
MGRLANAFFVLIAVSCGWGQAPVSDTPEVEKRVSLILSQMTTEEKIDLLGGINFFDVHGISRLKLPVLGTADGPVGVRNDGPATVMAGGIGLAATWDTDLAKSVGAQIGRDARAKGKHFLLGPGVNIYRAPLNGRNFEYFGEDPFLASRMAVNYIEGVQSQGVSATIKHFLGNNSEFGRHSTDSIIDERTLREIYLPVFEAAVKEAHVGSVMDSYNLVNGTHMTQNGYFNNEILKKDWGFLGIVMSDWGSTYDTIGAANGGLDLEMPFGRFFNRQTLLPAIQQGKVSMATLDDKVRRILRTEIQFGWPDRPQADVSLPRYNQQGSEVALQAAREAMVLLKNDGQLLPLDRSRIKTVALIGPDAYPAVPVGGGSAQVTGFRTVSFLEGLNQYLGSSAHVLYARGLPSLAHVALTTDFKTAPTGGQSGVTVETFDNAELSGAPSSAKTERHVNLGTRFDIGAISGSDFEFDPAAFSAPKPLSMRWMGYYTPTSAGDYDVVVQSGGFDEVGYRLFVDDKLLLDHWQYFATPVDWVPLSFDTSPHKLVLEYHATSGFAGPFMRMGVIREGTWIDDKALQMAAKADAVVLAVGFDPSNETEGADRTFRLPPGQEELIRAVASHNKNAIVVVTSGGSIDTNTWLAHVPALLEAWYPGQEGGAALPEILFGDIDPSGRLPITFEKRWKDNPVHDNYRPDGDTNKIVYREGIFVGYRGYEHTHTQHLFPFGYGLSYTTFKYSDLQVRPAANGQDGTQYDVSFQVTNAGKRVGTAVAEVYVAAPDSRVAWPKQLKGFARLELKPGESRRVTVPLNQRAFSYYDVDAKRWRVDDGGFEISVGSSVEQTELNRRISVPGQ